MYVLRSLCFKHSASLPGPLSQLPGSLPAAGEPSGPMSCYVPALLQLPALPGLLYTLHRHSSWTAAAAQVKPPVFTSVTVNACTNKCTPAFCLSVLAIGILPLRTLTEEGISSQNIPVLRIALIGHESPSKKKKNITLHLYTNSLDEWHKNSPY